MKKIAILSDLQLSDDYDFENFFIQFNDILNYFNILDEIHFSEDYENIVDNKNNISNVFRDDIVDVSLDQEQVLMNANYSENGYIKAPKVGL